MPRIALSEHGGVTTASFRCPGCGDTHEIPVAAANVSGKAWGFNGSVERPTFTPSILVRSGHFVQDGRAGECWCAYDREHPDDPSGFKCGICHSFVRDGCIEFLGDCTHALAGQTVDLHDIG